jgi:cytochrome c peroxidase
MKVPSRLTASQLPISKTLRIFAAGTALACILGAASQLAIAQNSGGSASAEVPAFAPGMIDHMQKMRRFQDKDHGPQSTPPIIPRMSTDRDGSGEIATFQPGGATVTGNNAFFQDLGTNGRTCFTCHQGQNGWSVSAESVAARFAASAGSDPIFRLVDGATCPTADVSTLTAKRQAYKLLTDKGLIRIGLPMPQAPVDLEFEITSVNDPYHCTTSSEPDVGLTSPTSGIVSIYRRPLPSTNLGFLLNRADPPKGLSIMWDGREPSLESQAIDATLGHAQADAPPTVEQHAQILAFEKGIFSAQENDNNAGSLHSDGAKGGPVALSLQLADFFVGVNDPLGGNPSGTPFNPNIFDIYRPWLGLGGTGNETQHRQAIARGEEVFNTTPINITGVAGLNDELNVASIAGFCGTCHDSPNVGNHTVRAPLNIGIADAGKNSPPGLDITGLPVFTLTCTKGDLKHRKFVVTDPGRALITGLCKDIGRFKGPILRGLASRAPYFHNGSAKTLLDVVNFYEARFNLGLTAQQKSDLVEFLNAL